MQLTIASVLEATGGRLVQGAATGPLAGVSTDSRTVGGGELFLAVHGERFDGHRFVADAFAAGASAAVVQRWPLEVPTGWKPVPPPILQGVPGGTGILPVILVDDTVAAYGHIAAAWAAGMPARVVTVTGSNGKTTTKEMIAHLLGLLGPTVRSEGNHNNHIGVPETLLRVRPGHRFAVVEMGTSHPGELERLAALVQAHVAVVTNIGPSHLEAFGSEHGVAHEKARLLDHLAPDGLAVLHADDDWSRHIAERHQGRKATFGLSPDADWRARAVQSDDDGVRFALAGSGHSFAVPVLGRHLVSDCLAAIATAAELGVGPQAAAERLATFVPPKWRMAVRHIGGMTLMLDCYNANPASMRGAIEELARRRVAGRRVAVLGDMLELGRFAVTAHEDLGRLVATEGFDMLCTVGGHAETVARSACLEGMAPGTVFWAADRQAAAQWLCARLDATDAVLVKGSRGVRLEDVADRVEHWAQARMREIEAHPHERREAVQL